MKHILLTIFIVITHWAFAQNYSKDFQPLSTTSEESTVLNDIQQRYQKDLKRIPIQHKKEIKKIYTNRYKELSKKIKYGYYIDDEMVNTYFQNILNHIIESNPKLKHRNIRLLISRSPAPNASCLGEGTLVLNIGLINQLENESQIAFVICHELAHQTRNHVNRSIAKSVHTLHSNETQKELSKISKSSYNKTQKAIELLKSITYDNRRHSREHEEEADSIGLSFLKNTKYDVNAAISLLEILDQVDQLHNYDIDLKKWFNHSEYPFKDRWLKKEDYIQMETGVEDEDFSTDSLKTHPDCIIRIKSVKRQLKSFEPTQQQLFIQNEEWLHQFNEVIDFEMIQRSYDYGNLSLCLYYTLQMLEKYPDNLYLCNMVGQCFETYLNARMEHEGSEYVPLASLDSDTDYNELLLFLNNLRTRELSKVAYYFMNRYKDKLTEHKNYLYTYIKHAQSLKKEEEAKALLEIYNKK